MKKQIIIIISLVVIFFGWYSVYPQIQAYQKLKKEHEEMKIIINQIGNQVIYQSQSIETLINYLNTKK